MPRATSLGLCALLLGVARAYASTPFPAGYNGKAKTPPMVRRAQKATRLPPAGGLPLLPHLPRLAVFTLGRAGGPGTRFTSTLRSPC
jgi:hypothetical protein